MFADVTSANVVGYMNVTRPQANFCSGSMFQNIGDEGIMMKNVKITGPGATQYGAWRNCTIQFFKTGNTAILDPGKKFWMDWNGTWRKFVNGGNFNDDPDATKEELEYVINPGEGFLCTFNNANAKITYSGEVTTGVDKKISIPRPQANFVVVNPSANDITLKEITISGPGATQYGAWRNCTIQFFKTGNTAILDPDKKFWMDWNGTWREFVNGGNFNDDPPATKEELDAPIKSCEGFLCTFNNANAVITMPTSL